MDVVTVRQRASDFGIAHSERNFRRMTSQTNLKEVKEDKADKEDNDDVSTTSSDLYEFDVYEREGYDKIMQTVAGVGGDGASTLR